MRVVCALMPKRTPVIASSPMSARQACRTGVGVATEDQLSTERADADSGVGLALVVVLAGLSRVDLLVLALLCSQPGQHPAQVARPRDGPQVGPIVAQVEREKNRSTAGLLPRDFNWYRSGHQMEDDARSVKSEGTHSVKSAP